MEAQVNELLPQAAKIAREFSNIPGLPHAEIELAAQVFLAHAARLFDPAKGDFTAYAALESSERLELAMRSLSPRLRLVAEGIRDGKSYSEIGTTLGVSKQAARKPAGAAITTLREKPEAMGFQCLDTLGLLKR